MPTSPRKPGPALSVFFFKMLHELLDPTRQKQNTCLVPSLSTISSLLHNKASHNYIVAAWNITCLFKDESTVTAPPDHQFGTKCGDGRIHDGVEPRADGRIHGTWREHLAAPPPNVEMVAGDG
jgi:hypothetical protein